MRPNSSARNLLMASLIQSTIANGRVVKIDLSAAQSAPGVLGILTRENAPHFKAYPDDLRKPGAPGENRVPLQDDEIYHDGQHLGVVVADSFEQATYAASLVQVTYQSEPPVVTLYEERAQKNATAPEKFAGREELQHKRGDVDSAIGDCSAQNRLRIFDADRESQPDRDILQLLPNGRRQTGCSFTSARAGSNNCNESLPTPLVCHRKMCGSSVLSLAAPSGRKAFQWSHTLLAAAAAKLVQRPVKLTFTRPQMFDSAGQRARTEQKLSLGADENGKLVALRHATTTHTSLTHDYTEPCGNMSRVLYSCPNVEVSHRLVRLNLATPCPMRAPGETPGVYALECALDELALQLGVDPVELRLRNYAEIDEYKNRPWSSKKLRECYQRAAEKFGWSNRNKKPGSMRAADGSQIGFGMATAVYPAGQQKTGATAILNKDGTVVVRCATHEIGTGTYTAMSQFAADTLGIPIEKIHFELGDSQFPVCAE